MTKTQKPRGRPPKSHDNQVVSAWLRRYGSTRDFCESNPRAEDVLTGCVLARERRDTGRGLQTRKLFAILQSLDAITSRGVLEVLGCAERTAQAYAIAASIASRAMAPLALAGVHPEGHGFQADAAPDMLSYGLEY